MKKLLIITICCFCLSIQAMDVPSSQYSGGGSQLTTITPEELYENNQRLMTMPDLSPDILRALIAQNEQLMSKFGTDFTMDLEESADSPERISTVDKVIRETERIVEQVKSWRQDTGKRLEGFGQKAGKDVEKVGQNLGAAAEKTGREVRRFFKKL